MLRFEEVSLWSGYKPPEEYYLSDVRFLSGAMKTAFQSKQSYVITMEQPKT